MLNIYQMDDTIAEQMQYRWLRFDTYNLEWLDYVSSLQNRQGDMEKVRHC